MISDQNKKAQDLYKHFFYFVLYNHFHENYSVLYKFETSNVRLLTEDIYLYLLEENHSYPHLNVMLDELMFSVDKDPVFRESFISCRKIINDIKKAQQEKNVQVIKKNISTLNKELNYQDKYLRRLQGFLSSFLSNDIRFFRKEYIDTSKYKPLYLDVLMSFVSEIQSKYSRKYIDSLREKFLENNTDFQKALDIFMGILFDKEGDYEVHFKIKIYKDFPSEKQSDGFEIFAECLKRSGVTFSVLETERNHKVFSVVIIHNSDVRDNFIISRNAKIKLLTLINSFLFEYNTFRVDVDRDVRVKKINDYRDWSFESVQMEKSEYHVHPKKDSVIQKFSDISRNKIEVDEDTLFRIENSLRYYSTFLHETEEDKKLLNLWISFENLFRNLESEQEVFSKIKSVLINLFTIYYVRESCDEFQNFILEKEKYLKKFNDGESRKYLDIIKHFQIKNDGIFNSIGICKTLCQQVESDSIFSKLDLVNNSYFYTDKYKGLARKLKKSETGLNANLFQELCKNERIVSWQIARIYRKRNQIVHGHKLGDLKVDLKDLVLLEYFYHLVMESIADFITSENYKTNSILEYVDKLNRSKEEYICMIKKEVELKSEYIVIPRIVI